MAVFADTHEAQIALNKLKRKMNKIENDAVNEATVYIAQRLEQNMPVWSGKKYNGKRGSYMQEHAKDHITFSKAKDGSAEVGFDDDVSWRVHFIEFGTVKQRPQAVVQKTQIEVEEEVIRILTKGVEELLS